MRKASIPRVVIAATSSGSGKTTVVTGILASLRASGRTVQSYKIGPDYIDPGYHQMASGKPGHNLDSWLVPARDLGAIFAQTARRADIAVIEGVMGLYDGGRKGVSSTAAIAKQLRAPVILVIDTKSMGDSAAAVALGFKSYDPEVQFAGVILNRLGSETHKSMISEAMAKIGIPVIGCLYRDDALRMPERHLGLTPITEHDAMDVVARIGRAVAAQIDLEALEKIARGAPEFAMPPARSAGKAPEVKIAVARDAAFSFYYPESLAVLEELGARLVPFSPLKDASLPEANGVIIGGGFPEMFARELEANERMRTVIFEAGRRGMPIYAECGGLMYLSRGIADFSGRNYAMVGLIPARCNMHEKLQTVGYIEAKALRDNALCAEGAVIRGHEFHFSSMVIDAAERGDFPWAFQFTKTRTNATYPSGYAKGSILASYLHAHFAGNLDAAKRWLEGCRAYAKRMTK